MNKYEQRLLVIIAIVSVITVIFLAGITIFEKISKSCVLYNNQSQPLTTGRLLLEGGWEANQ